MGYIEKGRAKTVTKIILWAVVISFVATIFVSWGAQRSEFGLGVSVFSINGKSINNDELQLNVYFYEYLKDRLVTADNYQQILLWNGAVTQIGSRLAGGLFQTINNQDPQNQQVVVAIVTMIGEMILSDQAKQAGHRITDKDIAIQLAKIYHDPDGNFLGQERITSDLSRYNIGSDSEPRFKDLLKRHLLARQYVSSLFASVQPELADQVKEVYEAQNRTISFQYAKYEPTNYLDELQYGDTELTTYLNEHPEEFVLLEGLVIDKALFADSLEISLDAINTYYEENKDVEFKEEETRDVRRILIKLAADAEETVVEETRAKIKTIYDLLSRPGEDFGTVARRFSEDDTATSEDGLIKGLNRSAARDQAFIDAVFAIEEAGKWNTEAIQTADGLEIIQLVAKSDERIKPLEEVRDVVRASIAEERAEAESSTKAEELRGRAMSEDWNTLAQPIYVTYQQNLVAITDENDLFALGQASVNSIGAPADMDEIFRTEEKNLTNVLDLFDSPAFFRIKAKGESLKAIFDQVKPAVTRRYTKLESAKLAKSKAEELAFATAEIKTIEEFVSAAGERSVTLQTADTNKYQGTFEFGADLLQSAFDAGTGAATGPIEHNGAQYVMFVTNVTPFDETQFAEQRKQIRDQLVNSWIQGQPTIYSYMNLVESNFSELLDAHVSSLVANSELKYNRDVIRQMFDSDTES